MYNVKHRLRRRSHAEKERLEELGASTYLLYILDAKKKPPSPLRVDTSIYIYVTTRKRDIFLIRKNSEKLIDKTLCSPHPRIIYIYII